MSQKYNASNTLKRILRDQRFFLICIIILISTGATALNPRFLMPQNLLNILQQISVIGMCTMGMTLMLITGQLDMGIGQLISLLCILMVVFVQRWQMPLALGLLLLVLFSISVSLASGWIVCKSRSTPLIITLGSGYVYEGIATYVSGGRFYTLDRKLDGLGKLKVFGTIPISILIMLAIVMISWLILNKTRYGRRLCSVGSNPENAFLCGINVDFHRISIYGVSGLFVAVGAIVLMARTDTATAAMGSSYTLQALASAVVGGVSFDGGKGTISGALIGCILLGLISNAMNVVGIPATLQTMVQGIIIIAAVVLSNLEKMRKQ
jgi:ribose transport system permease protein